MTTRSQYKLCNSISSPPGLPDLQAKSSDSALVLQNLATIAPECLRA
jgi:hypothetical protein